MAACMAVAINQQLKPTAGASTVEMKLNSLRPIKQGILRGQGHVLQKGKKMLVAQGEIKNDEGKLIAFGTATFLRIILTD